MSLNFIYSIFFPLKFTVSLMAPIYFDLPQKSDEIEVAERYRWTDRHVVQERNTIMAESGPNFLSAC